MANTGVSIKVVSNRIPSISAALRPLLVTVVSKAAFQIEAGAKARAHVITGTLRRSIHTVISNGGLTGTVGPSVDYGKYEEFGSRGRGAHPFMRPAAEAVMPQFVASVRAALAALR